MRVHKLLTVRSAPECVRRSHCAARHTPTQNAPVWLSQFTPPHQTRQDCRACLSTAAAATQARQAATPSRPTAHTSCLCRVGVMSVSVCVVSVSCLCPVCVVSVSCRCHVCVVSVSCLCPVCVLSVSCRCEFASSLFLYIHREAEKRAAFLL